MKTHPDIEKRTGLDKVGSRPDRSVPVQFSGWTGIGWFFFSFFLTTFPAFSYLKCPLRTGSLFCFSQFCPVAWVPQESSLVYKETISEKGKSYKSERRRAWSSTVSEAMNSRSRIEELEWWAIVRENGVRRNWERLCDAQNVTRDTRLLFLLTFINNSCP